MSQQFFSTMQWPAEAIWSEVEPLWSGFSVEVLPELGSTNTELMERARLGQMYPTLLVAEQQTAGRGRMGKSWNSHQVPGASLTFSLGLPMSGCNLSGLSLVVGYTLADALDPQHQHGITLKWPNDLWLQERKLGGILVEVCSLGAQRYVVIGIGLNILPAPSLPAPVPGQVQPMPPACLQELDPHCSAPSVLQRIASPLARALQQFTHQGFAAWQPWFSQRDALTGREVWLSDGSQGQALGVDAQGGLRIATPHGERTIISDEISIRPL